VCSLDLVFVLGGFGKRGRKGRGKRRREVVVDGALLSFFLEVGKTQFSFAHCSLHPSPHFDLWLHA
jgi:hypothetical protein